MFGDPRLSTRAREIIGDPSSQVYVSAVSALEIAIKVRIGKLPNAEGFIHEFQDQIDAQGFIGLDISIAHARFAGLLGAEHRDPFDRLLAAQSLNNGLPLISNDDALSRLVPTLIW